MNQKQATVTYLPRRRLFRLSITDHGTHHYESPELMAEKLLKALTGDDFSVEEIKP